MFHKKIKTIFILILFIALLSCTACFAEHTNSKNKISQQNVKLVNEKKFKKLDMNEDNLKIKFENALLNLNFPIYMDNNRYYVPVSEIIEKLNGKITINKESVSIDIQNQHITMDSSNLQCHLNHKNINLKKKIIISDEIAYIDLYDLTKILNLKTRWNHKDKIVSLYWNKDRLLQVPHNKSTKIALLRLEDITAGQRYSTAESLEKLRIISDYLYTESIPFSVAWVPKYVNPTKNISNCPDNDMSILNSDFIFTLDYFGDRDGLIGLHGYTHQSGNQESIVGTEFSRKVNSDEKSTRARINLAIESAKKLDIPIAFFESPHYAATPLQHKIMGEYFNIIYEHAFSDNEKKVTVIDYGSKKTTFIPTPLDYLDDNPDLNKMLAKINSLDDKTLGSLFFHPNIEFGAINLETFENGYPSHSYKENSSLHAIINALKNKGYDFRSIKDLN